MRVHLHTLCWNDRPMLDFFFRHYVPWVDRFFILDDGSTDGTREYLQARPDVVVGDVRRSEPESWVLSARQIYNSAWKQSIGEADWVLVTNIDEHLYHPSMQGYLADGLRQGMTVLPARGYQMLTDQFPAPDSVLWRDHYRGARWDRMDRTGVFRPDRIVDTHFEVGRHCEAFDGEVVAPAHTEILNLHYKYLGLDYTQKRHEALAPRFGAIDRAHGWGHKYAWSRSRLQADFEQLTDSLEDIRITAETDPAARG